MTHTLRLTGLASALLLLSACDTGAPFATADSGGVNPPLQSTTLSLHATGTDFQYVFESSDAQWDGSFTVSTLDEKGDPIVTYDQTRYVEVDTLGVPRTRYAFDFSWDPSLGTMAGLDYSSMGGGGGTPIGSDSTGAQGGDGDGDAPARSFHVRPNGATSVDYPQPGDPKDHYKQIVTPSGDELNGVADIAIGFAQGVAVPSAAAVRFTYQSGVKFTYTATPAPPPPGSPQTH